MLSDLVPARVLRFVPPASILLCLVLAASVGATHAPSLPGASGLPTTAGTREAPKAQEALRRILLTNDNGIEDVATLGLARALAEENEVFLVAPDRDRSGTSTYTPSVGRGSVTADPRDVGQGIRSWALDGTPGDCVLFALAGPLREDPPDLVVSGINGGPNLADDWIGSGTIGAARMAAWLGVPAVAVSGVEDDDPRTVEAVVGWTARLLDSPIVRTLEAPGYLTVSLPRVEPDLISGVEVTRRARGLLDARAELASEENGEQTWRLEVFRGEAEIPEDSDVAAVQAGRIAITAHRAGEYDPELAARLEEMSDRIPEWWVPEIEDASSGELRPQ